MSNILIWYTSPDIVVRVKLSVSTSKSIVFILHLQIIGVEDYFRDFVFFVFLLLCEALTAGPLYRAQDTLAGEKMS